MYRLRELQKGKCLESVGHCDLLVDKHGMTLDACWKPKAEIMIYKKAEQQAVKTVRRWLEELLCRSRSESLRGGNLGP